MNKVKTGSITQGDKPYASFCTVEAGTEAANKYKLFKDPAHAPVWQILFRDDDIEIYYERVSNKCRHPLRIKAEGDVFKEAKKDIENTTGKSIEKLIRTKASEVA